MDNARGREFDHFAPPDRKSRQLEVEAGEHDSASEPFGPPLASVGYRPEGMTGVEEWRNFLYRLYPTARRPVVRIVASLLYLIFAGAAVGYWIGMLGRPGLDPEMMAVCFGAAGSLFTVRTFRLEQMFRARYRTLGPIVFELDEEGVTVRSKDRIGRIEWAGVRDLLVNGREVVVLFGAGDVGWIPRRAFRDPAHEGRFLDVARSGIAESRHPST